MIIVTAPAEAAAIGKVLTDAGETVHEIGVVELGPGGEADCVIDHAESLWRG